MHTAARPGFSIGVCLAQVGLASSLCLVAGCSNDLSSVDRRVDELVRARSLLIGKSAASPRPVAPPTDGEYSRSNLNRTPATVSPDTDELRFTPASEARDVSARLDAFAAVAADATPFDLPAAWRQAQTTSRELLTAEEEYVLAAIRLLIARHGFDPQFFAGTTVGATATGTGGNFDVPLSILNQLGVTKNLEDGGQVAARLVWNATENLRESATQRYTQAASLVLSGQIPLLRGAGPSASEDLTSAERELVYSARTFEDFRRSFLVSIARDYFGLQRLQNSIVNQEAQLKSLRQLEVRTAALVAAGRLAEFERNIAANRVLSGAQSLANLRETYTLALDRFKIRLGLPVQSAITIRPSPLDLSEPEVTLDQATAAALEYRLDLQTRRDRLDDSERRLANAKNQLLPDLDLSGSVTLRTPPGAREGGLNIGDSGNFIYQGGATFNLPLDREVERLRVRAASIDLARSKRDLDQFRDGVVLDVRASVREIERARFNLRLAEEQVKINQRRQEEQVLKEAEITAQQRVETEADLLDAKNARDQAETDLRNAILNYLLESGQLRVGRDGVLLPLPGMTSTGSRPNEPAAAPDGETPAPGSTPATFGAGTPATPSPAPTPGAPPTAAGFTPASTDPVLPPPR